MPAAFKTIVNIAVWFLFLKGILAVGLTLYIVMMALVDGDAIPITAMTGCAAGAFAFILACVAAWIRQEAG